jgi:NAD+ kinase
MDLRTVAIVSKPHHPDVARIAAEVAQWFQQKNITATTDPAATSQADLVVVIGGDGTLLAAARLLGNRQIPILAVNYGGLGFLTEVTLDQLYPALERFIEGQFVTERRMMMEIVVTRRDQRIATYRALNDAVINKGTLARIIEIEAHVDGHYVSSFRSDGLIIATPTGSTAYNLSAGGPIIFPNMNAMVLTPICSHTLTNRPIVLPAGVRIDITLRSSQDEVYLTVDGQEGLRLDRGDRVSLEKSNVYVKLVEPSDKNYFDVLRGKLKWG